MNRKKSKYPHGTVKAVSNKLGISLTVVSEVLRNDKNSRFKTDILQATADYLNEAQTKERKAKERLSAVMNQPI